MLYLLIELKQNFSFFINKINFQDFIPITLSISGLLIICGANADCLRFSCRNSISISAPIGGVHPSLASKGLHSRSIQNRLRSLSNRHRKLPSQLNTLSTNLQGLCHPLRGKGFLSQGIRGPTHQGRMEYAYDFGVPIGTPVYAMQSGRVIGIQDHYADIGGKKGKAQETNFVWLEHRNGVGSAYTHLQQRFGKRTSIQLNDWVKEGQLIGYSGNSGWSTAPHLHVEVHHISTNTFGKTLPFSISSPCNSEQST